ncbi:MAG TPA: 5-methyltetrahydropteroyltriglutamate--homocysteine S-methyltransferase [Acidimicrobiales bacterium]|nr:5-methyltetrahydropteroyltriglutamate--homocysteine S-methyltransferase [Acidimicrobiales bacterium]
MRTAVHGMPRIGPNRALKWALEGYWAGTVSDAQLDEVTSSIRRRNWMAMTDAKVDFVPSNDFSLYDHVLDAAVMVGAIAPRFASASGTIDRAHYFAMARGGEVDGKTVAPLDLTKWFDTNYHHLVPEFGSDATFVPDATKASSELAEAATLGVLTTPVLLGPMTLLLRSASPHEGVDVLELLDPLVDAYVEVLAQLERGGAAWVRLDEPALVEERSPEELDALRRVYRRLGDHGDRPNIALSTYFGHLGLAMGVARDLPVEAVGLDFCRGRENLDLLRSVGGLADKVLFAGLVDGRNVWSNNLHASLDLLDELTGLATEIVVSTSCSLLHVPLGRAADENIDQEVRPWLAFAHDKLGELAILARGASEGRGSINDALDDNRARLATRRNSARVTDHVIRQRVASFVDLDPRRSEAFPERATDQRAELALPLLPTTTIGSFPQTSELRRARASWRAGNLDDAGYDAVLRAEIDHVLNVQEEIGLDVLVHGEPERNDMVRFFAEQLSGFALADEGWVQSYGSRCVRPPILFGDVARPGPMTLKWTQYAQSRTSKPVKGMLTGPITMLRWSFVRDDQPERDTADQLALAIRDELVDLQAAGISIIQVDEPALREGLPLRSNERPQYLMWATRAFRLITSAAAGATQVHTHMCYAELGDIVQALDELDVDVLSFEAARSDMASVDVLHDVSYQGGVGPGIYDVHSPLVPEVAAIEGLLRRALVGLGPDRLWVNPDCGLKTRRYEQVLPALDHLVTAARRLRTELGNGATALGADGAGADGASTETPSSP